MAPPSSVAARVTACVPTGSWTVALPPVAIGWPFSLHSKRLMVPSLSTLCVPSRVTVTLPAPVSRMVWSIPAFTSGWRLPP